jgi:hypothetical protein
MRIWLLILIFLTMTLTACTPKPEQRLEQTQEQQQDQDVLERFMGTWKQELNGERYLLELKDNVELIGVFESDLLSRAEFTVLEINRTEPSIIVHGQNEDLTALDLRQNITEYDSKLILQDDGKKLLYIYDYKKTKIKSEWHR